MRFVIYYIAVSLIFLYLLFFIAVASMSKKEDRNNSAVFKFSVRIVSVLGIALNTILTVPIYQLIANAIFCTKSNPFSAFLGGCYQQQHLFYTVIGAIAGFLLFIELVMINLFCTDMNPSSKHPTASFSIGLTMLRLLMKIYLCGVGVLDFKVGRQ